MNKVIIINGNGGVGKDTFVEICQKILPHRVLNVSTVDFVKYVAYTCGWDGNKTEKSRLFLSDLKDALSRWDDVPYQKVCSFLRSHDKKIIFVHSREPEEIERFKKEWNAITVLITNSRVASITSNHADNEVENYDYDYIISNNGTLDDFKNKASTFLLGFMTFLAEA